MNESALKLEKFLSKSREKGLKLTPQRMVIFNILAESNRHMTVDEIYTKAKVQYPMLSPATVYRNMEQMVDAGLLTHLDLGGASVKYDTNLDEHHHFVCNECGKVVDLYLKDFNYDIDNDKSPLGNMRVDSTQLYLHGVCGECG
ncbi:MAG: Fur family transcriptional regulator [Deltaproteobacteria bacterium]